MRKLFVVIFCLLSLHVMAQKELWHSGSVVTSDNEVLTGEIVYYPVADVVVVRNDGQTNVLNISRIGSFRIYDAAANINRRFISLPGENPAINSIYEVVVAGEIPVLRKLKGNWRFTGDDNEYYYYFLNAGQITSLKRFRSKLYPQIQERVAMEEKQFRLNPNLPADAIRYIEFYNRRTTMLASR